MSLKKVLTFIAISLLVLSLSLVGFFYFLSQPMIVQSQTPANEALRVQFVIPRGQAISVIASRLKNQNLIRSSLIFRFIVMRRGLEKKLQSGSFQISPTMTPVEIATTLTQGTDDIWVTILEGWRREQVAASLTEAGLVNFNTQEFLNLTQDQEGKIFPDSYLFSRESTTTKIYQVMHDNFVKKVEQGLAKDIEQSTRGFDKALVMASIIEREARGYQEMRHVAGILWNRYDINMALQADATLQYAKGFDEQTQSWWKSPTSIDKKINSPFNTYLNPGLPPQPISNPGLEAIKAALNPLSTTDFFYLHDQRGGIHYAQSLEEHNANIQRYLR